MIVLINVVIGGDIALMLFYDRKILKLETMMRKCTGYDYSFHLFCIGYSTINPSTTMNQQGNFGMLNSIVDKYEQSRNGNKNVLHMHVTFILFI